MPTQYNHHMYPNTVDLGDELQYNYNGLVFSLCESNGALYKQNHCPALKHQRGGPLGPLLL